MLGKGDKERMKKRDRDRQREREREREIVMRVIERKRGSNGGE